ncbi:hypothetical protein, partial [Cellulomonas denverensis]|uniref:hypothetical protein n=1 Tax=Cellulomonas denverensis TaxID=264297 RepID=UPI0019434F6E
SFGSWWSFRPEASFSSLPDLLGLFSRRFRLDLHSVPILFPAYQTISACFTGRCGPFTHLVWHRRNLTSAEAPVGLAGGWPPAGPATGLFLGVRSSLPGDSENITQHARSASNPQVGATESGR